MKENTDEQTAVRKYLLGSLNDETGMRRIEEQILLDDDFIERLSIAEDNLIEDYLEANLSEDERKRFEQFFLISAERKQKLLLTENLRKYASQYNPQNLKNDAQTNAIQKKRRDFDWRSIFASMPLRFAVVAFVICGIGIGVWRVNFNEADSDKGIAELRALYRSERPFESRLSNFEYAPFSVTRGGDKQAGETLARDRAARKLLDAAQNEPGAKSFHALGNYYLTEKQFEQAISQFDAALKLDSNNAALYNDYGVALLEKAKQAGQPGEQLENLARANEHFNKAIELNETLLEAFFNRAVVLQQMNGSPEQTKKAWNDYLEKDSTSKWAEEARRNLEKLNGQTSSAKKPEQVLADFFDAFDRKDEERAWQIVSQTREMITDTMVFFQLTKGFLADDAAGQTESAKKHLAAMQFVGKMEKEKAGDLYFAELAEFYASSNQQIRQILFQAQTQVKSGYLLSKDSKYSEAITTFQQAEKSFAGAGNVWESKLSEYWIGFWHDRIGKIDESIAIFTALENYCQKKTYKWLAAQPLNWLAESAFYQNEYSKAINYLNAALKITRENSDTFNQQKLLARLGSYYSDVGELQKSLVLIEEGLITRPDYFTSDRQAWRSCLFAAETLYRLKLYNTAISFGREALHIGSEKMTDASANHTSYYTLALLYGGSGDYSSAIEYARKSLDSVQSVNEQDKRLLTNFSLLRTAHLYRQSGNCDESLKIYLTVIEETASQTDAMELELNNYEAHKGRLLCYFALNRSNAIKEELDVVLNLYEKFRSEILEEQTRNVFFDNEQTVYDLAVDYARSQNDFQAAFETAEKSKARSVLNSFHLKNSTEKNENKLTERVNQATRPLLLDEIQRRLPEQTQIVQYAVLSDKILIWVITRTQFHLVEKKITSSEISEQVESYLKVIAEGKSEKKDDAKASGLYETLIAPVLPYLDLNKEVCIVPDKSLYRLPFAALISPADNHFLIEDYAVFSAPSATMLILSSEAAGRFAESDEKILAVGNPYFDREEFPDLEDLPDSEAEAVKIAAFYQTAKTLIGKQANKNALVNNLAGSDVFHFAGHFAVNESAPLRSRLLLAKTGDDDADIETHEILEKNLDTIKLAVLSACRTGTENYYNGEGMIGAARGFLAKGVPLVVASQWDVDSDATAELMIKFHFYRKQHRLSTTNALRRAQLEMLNSSNERFRLPYYWAGFLPVGGHTDY
jgi:CHAT domain-containing protein